MDARDMKPYVPHLAVIALMAATCLALYFGVDASLADEPGVRMALPRRVGDWTGQEVRYCHARQCGKDFLAGELADRDVCPECGEPLYSMSRIEHEQLPQDTEFLKGRYTNEAGVAVSVAVVLSGRERSSIHRPQRCLVGQGNEIVQSRVMRVPMDGRKPLDVMLLNITRRFQALDGRRYEHSALYAYWFVGKDRETPYHLERMFWLGWDRLVRNVAEKWAYVTVMTENTGNPEADSARLAEFIAEFYPQIRL